MRHVLPVLILTAGIFVIGSLLSPAPVRAEICWAQRVVNQHRCTSGGSSGCLKRRSQSKYSAGCYGETTGNPAPNAQPACEANCGGPYPDPCYGDYCVEYGSATYSCDVERFVASCTSEPSCNAIANIASCNVNQTGTSCSNSTQTLTYECWGPGNPTSPPGNCGNGICGTGESCATCPADCGACCGNGTCGSSESCSTCAADCGACPPTCGNGVCASPETCSTCSTDCGSCFNTPTPTSPPQNTPTPWCGDSACNSGENCTNCPNDCGSCPGNTNTPTPTEEVGQCQTPVPSAITISCAPTAVSNGNITWTWPAILQADEYEITLLRVDDSPVTYYGWRTAISLGCSGSGTCTFTTSALPNTYKLSVRARGTGPDCSYASLYGKSDAAGEVIGVCNGTISAVAKLVDYNDTSCTDVSNSPDYVYPVTFSLNPNAAPGPQTQTDQNPVTWPAVSSGSYTLGVTPPSGYVVRFLCWQRSFTAPTTGNSATASLVAGETLNWYGIGLALGTPWVQTRGGDVLVNTTVQSHMADTVAPREFNITGSGGYPGVVSYGSSYDFDPSPANGVSYVSSTNWIVPETGLSIYTKNWYNAFAEKYDLTGNSQSYTGPAKPASSAIPYAVNGSLTIGNWNVPNGESIVLFVNGDLTINGPITTTGTGFVAFIVSGDILVSSAVGGTYNSATPVLEGLYVTNGEFNTGASQIGAERLVTQGIFIANDFRLQRDLANVSGGGQNHTTSSELFIYDPQLLVTMPDEFRDIRLKWEEVAP